MVADKQGFRLFLLLGEKAIIVDGGCGFRDRAVHPGMTDSGRVFKQCCP